MALQSSKRRRITAPPPPIMPTTIAEQDQEYISSGSVMLDLVLGGGWATRHVVNVVGDRSAGKTGLAIEACANFIRYTHPLNIRYLDCESAFNTAYGQYMGMPDGVDPEDRINTVEGMFNDLMAFTAPRIGNPDPSLFVVDSLDSLTVEAELKRDMGESTYNMEKAKYLGELFRKQITAIGQANCTFFVISQLRDNIGVMFGERSRRSGGRALDYYAVQCIWLAEIEKLTQTVYGVKRVTGVKVRVRNKKNKVGMPFRDAELTLVFGYGIDDEVSMLDWLGSVKHDSGLNLTDFRLQLEEARRVQDREWIAAIHEALRGVTTELWYAIEDAIAPPMRKYV